MVSIIVPVYKSELTLTRCVESLLSQDYKDIEILLIVDGPPDGSGILADELKKRDDRIRVINQPNQGVSHARNTGILHAKGEYIRFVDSDDYVCPTELSEMVSRMEADDSDMVICGYHHLYFGRVITKVPHMDGVLDVPNDFADMKRLYRDGFLNMPWNKLFKTKQILHGHQTSEKHTEVYSEHGGNDIGFPENLSLGEDLVFNQNYIAGVKRISVIPICVCEYVQDDRGTTLSTKKRDDKIDMALLLYEKSALFFQGLYGQQDLTFLKEKVMTTFLDEIECIGFAKADTKEKKESLQKYMKACRQFANNNQLCDMRFALPDYRIIYFFVRKNKLQLTYLMVRLRTIVVKFVRMLRRRER